MEEPELELVTSMAASAVHTVPDPFHALMWTVCWPDEADAWLLSEVPLLMVVAPLSMEYPIAVTACEEQVGALAETVNGDATEAPAVGELMVTPELEVEVVVVVLPLPETTLTAMLSTQEEPPLPHALTWTVCAPVEVVMEAATEVLCTMAV